VRDRLLGRPVKDVDMEVYGLYPEIFGEAMERLGADGVGKSFFVYRYGDLDLSLPRKERKVGTGHRGFAVEPADDEREATRRRDFSVNAMMYDMEKNLILDYWGGLEDIKFRKLRCVSPETFIEDSLRVLRGMQFSARFGFRIDKDTCRLCRGMDLSDLPGARIRQEFEKMFSGEWFHYGFYAMLELGIAEKLWGEKRGKKIFFSAARRMAGCCKGISPDLKRFCFMAVYRQYTDVDMGKILDAIDASNPYRKALEKLPKIPPEITPSWVARQALKKGICDSALGCDPAIRKLARKLDIWEKPLEIGVKPSELMESGFHGRYLGEELERLQEEKIIEMEKKFASGNENGTGKEKPDDQEKKT